MLAPSTELDAINYMLSTIGEAPVSTVEDTGVVDAVLAKQTLDAVSREVQTRGWHFNTEKSYELTPTYLTGEITLPSNTVRVDTVGDDASIDVVQRGSRLYDRVNHTYEFDKSLTVDLLVLLEFDELPEAARFYITVRASRIYQEHVVGSSELSGFSYNDEARALMGLLSAEADTADYNILTGSYSVSRVLER